MSRAIEQEIRALAQDSCEYCRLPEKLSKLKFVLDHVIARQHGGEDTPDNLALACGFCNRHKGPNVAGIDPPTLQMGRLFHPRQDKWRDHFRWNEVLIIGMTSIGRTTIVVLAMNHPYQLAVRQALFDEGLFLEPSPH